jgi:hypothetical protein
LYPHILVQSYSQNFFFFLGWMSGVADVVSDNWITVWKNLVLTPQKSVIYPQVYLDQILKQMIQNSLRWNFDWVFFWQNEPLDHEFTTPWRCFLGFIHCCVLLCKQTFSTASSKFKLRYRGHSPPYGLQYISWRTNIFANVFGFGYLKSVRFFSI